MQDYGGGARDGVERIAERLAELLVLLGDDPQAAFGRIDDLYAEDIFFEDPLTRLHGRDAFHRMNRQLVALAREFHVDVHERAVAGDSIFLAWTFHYRVKFGPLLHVPGVTRARVRDGKVVEHRDYWDLLSSLLETIPGLRTLQRRLVERLG